MTDLSSRRAGPSRRERGSRGARPNARRFFALVGFGLAAVVAGGIASDARAHPLAPMLLELVERNAGHVDVRWKEPAMGSRGLALAPDLPEACRLGRPAEPAIEDGGVVYRWHMVCPAGGLTGQQIGVEGLSGSRANVLLRVELEDGRSMQMLLTGRRPAWTVPEEAAHIEVARRYVVLGVTHLAGGPDHLLFLVCLMLIVSGRRALIATITAFTLGHALTLTLAALGRLTVDETVVEVGIAFSIVVLAAELAGRAAGRGSSVRGLAGGRPWAVAFAFGLLHGLGFAGALAQVGLPRVDLALALAGFNIGIELGQLAFIAALLGLAAVVARVIASAGAARGERGEAASTPFGSSARLFVPFALQRGVAYGVGTLAAYWCIERAAGLG